MEKELVQSGEILFYNSGSEKEFVSVIFKEENFWLTQKAMGELFDCSSDNISLHLKNIFAEEELDKDSVTEKFSVTAADGKKYKTQCYNLDAIIAVGYRVNSKKATRFRQWATKTLKEYIQKGFVLNDELMKNGRPFGRDYFDELLERIREIRASERRIWQQVTDIFAECSIDYDKNTDVTHQFYAMVQNKFHYAITGQTAAEIVYTRADHTKDHMGLETWKHAPDGRILKSDVSVAKNYLNAKQIRQLERTVTGYFDYIEDLIERENTFTMEESRQVLEAGLKYGLRPKIHADEIEAIGGSQLAGEIGAISAEHLIVCPPEGIESMARGGVVACLLPATSFYLGATFAPARDMVNAGVPVAMATDFNPGSCPCLNLQFVINLGCLKYKLTPEEVLTAVTLNAAAAIDMAGQVGSVEPGKQGDLVIWDAPDLDYICYRMGSNLAKTVIKKGAVVVG